MSYCFAARQPYASATAQSLMLSGMMETMTHVEESRVRARQLPIVSNMLLQQHVQHYERVLLPLEMLAAVE